MAAGNSINQSNLEQLRLSISEIALLASSLKRLCLECAPISTEDMSKVSQMMVGGEKLAGMIGWIADNCSELLGSGKHWGGADEWLLCDQLSGMMRAAEVRHD